MKELHSCQHPIDPDHPRSCLACKRSKMKAYRATHRLTGDARKRANARAYAHVYLRRGKLVKKPCEVCGNPEVEMHHADYSKPLNVEWLCRAHHREVHRIASKW